MCPCLAWISRSYPILLPRLNGFFLSPQAARHRSANVLYKELAASTPFRAPATTRDTAAGIHIKYRQICLFQLVDGGSYAFLSTFFFIKTICVWCLPQVVSLEICTRGTSQAMLVASLAGYVTSIHRVKLLCSRRFTEVTQKELYRSLKVSLRCIPMPLLFLST
jgi:hypothetical protein